MQNQSASDHVQLQDQLQNEVERLLIEVREWRIPLVQFVRALTAHNLFILSTTEVKEDGTGLLPLLFDRNDVPLAAVFTSPQRATMHAESAPFLLQMNGLELLSRIPQGYGLVINRGHPVELELMPQGIENIIRDVSKT